MLWTRCTSVLISWFAPNRCACSTWFIHSRTALFTSSFPRCIKRSPVMWYTYNWTGTTCHRPFYLCWESFSSFFPFCILSVSWSRGFEHWSTKNSVRRRLPFILLNWKRVIPKMTTAQFLKENPLITIIVDDNKSATCIFAFVEVVNVPGLWYITNGETQNRLLNLQMA